jgi:HK97 family phage major capsid protein
MANTVLARLHDERQRLLDSVDDISNAAEAEDRDLSEAELQLISRHRTRVDDELDPQIDQLQQIEVSRSRHRREVAAIPERQPARAEQTSDDDQLIYRTFAQYARDELIRRYDSIAQLAGPGSRQAAEQRISRVMANTLSGDIPGLIPPQHITQIMQVISTSRPVVEASRKIALTSGHLHYPRITSRPIVGEQTAEKTELPSQKMTVEILDRPAKTFGGAGDLSWQAVQWSTPDALALWFDLAAEAYARQTEIETCELLAALAGTITVGSADLAGWMGALTSAAGAIYSATGRMANTIATDVATGFALLGLVGTANPVFLAAGSGNLATASGTVAGFRLVISPGMPAGTVIIGDFSALIVAETAGAPVELRAVEPSIAGFEVGVVGAFLAEVVEAAAFQNISPPAPEPPSTRGAGTAGAQQQPAGTAGAQGTEQTGQRGTASAGK